MLLRKEQSRTKVVRKEQRKTITRAKTEIKLHVSFNELSRSRRILQFYRVTQQFYLVFTPCYLFTDFLFQTRQN